VNTSLWQTPQACILMRTSPIVGVGISRLTISKSAPGFDTCAAFIVVVAVLVGVVAVVVVVVAMMPPFEFSKYNVDKVGCRLDSIAPLAE
jgi:hypothetical protein